MSVTKSEVFSWFWLAHQSWLIPDWPPLCVIPRSRVGEIVFRSFFPTLNMNSTRFRRCKTFLSLLFAVLNSAHGILLYGGPCQRFLFKNLRGPVLLREFILTLCKVAWIAWLSTTCFLPGMAFFQPYMVKLTLIDPSLLNAKKPIKSMKRKTCWSLWVLNSFLSTSINKCVSIQLVHSSHIQEHSHGGILNSYLFQIVDFQGKDRKISGAKKPALYDARKI